LSKSIAIEPGLLELLQKVAGVRFFWDTVYFKLQGRSGSSMLVASENSSAVLVMINNKFVLICNRFYA